MLITGKAITYGDDINTDLIYPGRYTYILLTEEQMGEHALEDLDPEFKDKDANGAILVAGKNFGCGSAREQAVKCLKQRGIKVIIARSFSRIYYRNCINEGLLPVVCPEAVEAIQENDVIEVNDEKGTVRVNGKEFSFPGYPEYVLQIIYAGGLIRHVKAQFNRQRAEEEENAERRH